MFPGDAEWKGKKVKKGEQNSSWDVMLKMDKNRGHLSKPLDFLKVGHHGSVNGTPFIDKKGAKQPVLDKLLPEQSKAFVVVSTLAGKHGEKKKVPYPNLMKELGRRAVNSREYRDIPGVKHPQRTDHEKGYIDVTFGPFSD